MTMETEKTIVTKSEYAQMKGRVSSAVSNWLAAGRITPAALVGSGERARIWVEQADRDLARLLDPGQQDAQRNPISGIPISPAAAAARDIFTDEPDEVIDEIRQARLHQLRHQNQKLAEDAALRSGRYMLTAEASRQMGRNCSSMLLMWEGWLQEFCQAVAGQFSIPLRDLQHEASKRYRELRGRAAADLSSQARKMPRLIQDGDREAKDAGETEE